jgi:hypothetical protein
MNEEKQRHPSALPHSYLPRLQLFEFHELPWFPEVLRNAITEILRVLGVQLGVHTTVGPLLENLMAETGSLQIVDLCSGAGGPILAIHGQLLSRHTRTPIVLTDKFPNLPAFEAAAKGGDSLIGYHAEPVDARMVPPQLKGLRTLFNAFHHFDEGSARQILADAFHQKQPIAIFEMTERSLFNTGSNFVLSALTMLALMPKMRNKRVAWWLATYIVPILPLTFGWDGFISCLRSYTAAEFHQLVQDLKDDSYEWRTGRVRVPGSPVHINYYFGVPRK